MFVLGCKFNRNLNFNDGQFYFGFQKFYNNLKKYYIFQYPDVVVFTFMKEFM